MKFKHKIIAAVLLSVFFLIGCGGGGGNTPEAIELPKLKIISPIVSKTPVKPGEMFSIGYIVKLENNITPNNIGVYSYISKNSNISIKTATKARETGFSVNMNDLKEEKKMAAFGHAIAPKEEGVYYIAACIETMTYNNKLYTDVDICSKGVKFEVKKDSENYINHEYDDKFNFSSVSTNKTLINPNEKVFLSFILEKNTSDFSQLNILPYISSDKTIDNNDFIENRVYAIGNSSFQNNKSKNNKLEIVSPQKLGKYYVGVCIREIINYPFPNFGFDTWKSVKICSKPVEIEVAKDTSNIKDYTKAFKISNISLSKNKQTFKPSEAICFDYTIETNTSKFKSIGIYPYISLNSEIKEDTINKQVLYGINQKNFKNNKITDNDYIKVFAPKKEGEYYIGICVKYVFYEENSKLKEEKVNICSTPIKIEVEDKKEPKLTSIKIDIEDSTLRKNSSKQIKVIGYYDNNISKDITSLVDFEINNSSIVSIENGILKALDVGTTTIKAKIGNLGSNSITITVIDEIDESKIIKNSLLDQYKNIIPFDSTANYDSKKFAIITGIAKDKEEHPLSGVTIKILNHNEYGSVKTDAKGEFKIPVNGGETLTVTYTKESYLPLHREIDVPIQNWANIEESFMSKVDSKVTEITLSSNKVQTHTSSKIVDERGERETTLVFDGVTNATVTKKDGTQTNLKTLKVRATEFDKPKAMPAKLPDGTAFTYCTALTVDGVEPNSEISFDKPVVLYLDNFLGFKVGEAVPVGYYDEKKGEWKAYENGVVVKLLDSNNDGTVDGLDSNGDDIADDLNGNGDTTDEVAGIKDNPKYSAGKTYWRAEIPHFSTWDLNYGSAPKLSDEDRAIEDSREVNATQRVDDEHSSCSVTNSYVNIQNQVYHEDIPINGTNLTLHYSSERVKGYKHIVSSQVIGDKVPSALIEIVAKFEIAGRTFTKTLPAEPNQKVEFIWDGLDSDGKRVQGTISGKLSVGYKYEAYYLKPPSMQKSFGQSSEDFTDVKANPEVKWKTDIIKFNNPIENQEIANGWNLSNHNFYSKGVVFKGNGAVIKNPYFISRNKINGELINDKNSSYNTIDYWIFKTDGGKLTIDVLSEYSDDPNNYVDLNGDGKQEAVDIMIFLFKKDANGNWIYVAENDDSDNFGNDGSVHRYDSYLELDLEAGEYLLTVSNYNYNANDALSGKNPDTNYRNGGPYQVIFNKHLYFTSIPYNSKFVNNEKTKVTDSSSTYLFDIDGKHLKTLDTYTQKALTTFEYDENDRLIKIKDQFNNTIEIVRDTDGKPTQIVAPNGQITYLTIDENNNLTTIGYEDNSNYQFEYDEGSLLLKEIEPNGNSFEHIFDNNGRVVKVLDELGGIKEYLKSGSSYSVKTALGNIQTIVMNGINQETTTPSGKKITTTYQNDGMTKIVKSCGVETTTEYKKDEVSGDDVVKKETIKLPSGKSLSVEIDRTYTYNNENNSTKTITTKKTTNNKTTTTITDYESGVTSATSPMGRVAKTYFNTDNLLPTKVEVANLEPTLYEYDSKGRVVKTKTGDRVESISYDARGNIASITDANGKTTKMKYDLIGRVTKLTTPSNATIYYSYDKNGNMTILTTPNENDHKFTYNKVNKNTSYISATSKLTKYEYDLERKLKKITYPSGKTKEYIYNKTLLSSIQTDEGTTNFEYDCLENLTKATYGSESIEYAYDGSLLTKIKYSGLVSKEIEFEYNSDFQLSKISYANSSEDLTYDKDGLLNKKGLFSISRDTQNGLPLSIDDGTLQIQREYNRYGELNKKEDSVGGDNFYSYELQRDSVGKITQKIENIAGESHTYIYSYNSDDRLIEVKKDGVVIESYSYDKNGNRVSSSVNEDDQLLTYKGVTYSYDNDGYLKSKKDDTGTTTYEYGINGELKKVTLSNGKVIEYLHNANHQRVAKKINGEIVEKYLWLDLTTLLATYDKDNNLIARFEYADSRVPIAMQKSGKRYYLHYDQVGTLKLITDKSGNIVKKIEYDSYGNILSDSNPDFKVPFGFAGGLYDSDTKLTQFGYRDYDSFSGRWTAKDPILFNGGDINLYGYVLGDPVNFVDRKGLEIGKFMTQEEFKNLQQRYKAQAEAREKFMPTYYLPDPNAYKKWDSYKILEAIGKSIDKQNKQMISVWNKTKQIYRGFDTSMKEMKKNIHPAAKACLDVAVGIATNPFTGQIGTVASQLYNLYWYTEVY